MAITEIIMPKMGESIMEATVLNWLKQPGDYVEADEFIVEVATDKIDTEVPSPIAGYLKSISSCRRYRRNWQTYMYYRLSCHPRA